MLRNRRRVRKFLQTTGTLAAGSALAGVMLPHVHAAESNTIRLALIGCGGRGSGAVKNACEAGGGPVKLVAMADLFEKRLQGSHRALSQAYADKVDVPAERRFIGFGAYRKAIDCLRPGDVAMLTGYAGFRPGQLEYAVEKGVNVFMEKSFATDPPGVRRVIQAGEAAEKKNLKIAAGLMCRHSREPAGADQADPRRPTRRDPPRPRLSHGAVRPAGPLPRDRKGTALADSQFHEVLVGLRRTVRRNGHPSDRRICWLKGGYPVTAHGVRGRAANNNDCSQNLDSFSIEWTFADGAKGYDVVRYIPKCFNEFATFVHGTKCAAQFSGHIHAGTVRIYKDQRIAPDNIAWEAPKETVTPWQAEWNDLLDSIRNDRPHNEAKRAAMTNLADIMGRAAVHMGRVITWDEAMASNFKFCPEIDSLQENSPAPVKADANGRYPTPIPGQWTEL